MNHARYIYLEGKIGEIIYARLLSRNLYRDAILQCPYCRETVYFREGKQIRKDGQFRANHFAHNRRTDKRIVNECELRSESYGDVFYSYSKWKELTPLGKGQRYDLLKKYLFKAIINESSSYRSLKNFNRIVKITKEAIEKIEPIKNIKPLSLLSNNVKELYALEVKRLHIEAMSCQNNNWNTKIVLEILDFLSQRGQENWLQELIYYSTYRLLEKGEKLWSEHNYPEYAIAKIIEQIIKIIKSVDWLAYFEKNQKDYYSKVLILMMKTGVWPVFVYLMESDFSSRNNRTY